VTETSIPQQAALVRDFVNSYDVEAGTEALSGPDELGRFLAEHALPTGVPTGRDLADAVAVREGLRAALRANHDGTVPAVDLDRLTRAFPLRLDFTDEGPTLMPVQDGPRGGIATILAAAAASGQDGTWRRLKVCPADTCQWAFYDTSRNRSRTWCAMNVCGNREKTRAYRSRRRD
jgi:predicted RNA-binding Zn ribbon-like protein